MRILMLIFSVIMLTSCGTADQDPTAPMIQKVNEGEVTASMKLQIRTLDQSVAKKNIDEDKTIILLDVRTVDEYKELHIPNSVLIPLDTISDRTMTQKIPDKQATVYIYCRSGNRSKTAYDLLYRMGYLNIYDIGGINTWPFTTEVGK